MEITYEEFCKDPMKYILLAETEEIHLTKRGCTYIHMYNPNADKLKIARTLQGSISEDLDISDFIR